MSAVPPMPPPRPRLVPQAGPAAWRAAALRVADWMVPLGAEDAAEIEAVIAALGGRAPASAADAPLPRLGPVLRQAAAQLDSGRGFALLRGLKLVEPGAEALLLVLGIHLGRALPQGPQGEAVARLASPAGDVARWRFRAEAADIVALLTLRPPPEADPLRLVAAASVHNEMMQRDRQALAALHAPLPHLLRPLVAGAAPQVVELPVFSSASGAFIGRYARDAIEAAQRLPTTPRLTPAQVQALDLLDAICAEPGFALRLDLRPGDVLLFNPLQIWRQRAEGAEAAPGTFQALQVLLVTPTSRALPGGMVVLDGGAPPGMPGGMVGG